MIRFVFYCKYASAELSTLRRDVSWLWNVLPEMSMLRTSIISSVSDETWSRCAISASWNSHSQYWKKCMPVSMENLDFEAELDIERFCFLLKKKQPGGMYVFRPFSELH